MRARTTLLLALSGLGLSSSGCPNLAPFVCDADVDCVRGGVPGMCLDGGACAYPDAACESGLRYSPRAGEQASECVAADVAGDDSGGDGMPAATTDDGGDESGSSDGVDACVDDDGDGYGVGNACVGADCDDGNPSQHDTCSYISPTGSDAGAGTREDPYATFAHATASLAPGQSLVLLDGDYTPETTGMIFCDCEAADTTCFEGTAASPVSIRAENERRAVLRPDVDGGGIDFRHCDGIKLHGLTVVAPTTLIRADGSHGDAPVTTSRANDLTIERMLVVGADEAYPWQGTMYIWGSERATIVDVEVYNAHYAGAALTANVDSVVRRFYVSGRERDLAYGISVLLSQGVVLEDLVVENAVHGINLDGGSDENYDPMRDSRVVGAALVHEAGGDNAIRLKGRLPDELYNIEISEVVSVGYATGIGLYGARDVAIAHSTFLGATDGAISGHSDDFPCDTTLCSYTASAVLVEPPLGAAGTFPLAAEWDTYRIDGSNVAEATAAEPYPTGEPWDDADGSLMNNIQVDTPQMGLEAGRCKLAIPAASPMKGAAADGADIGANFNVRHVDGVATGEPLWDPQTGAFPCGAIVPGINDVAGSSCFDVHDRLDPLACQ